MLTYVVPTFSLNQELKSSLEIEKIRVTIP